MVDASGAGPAAPGAAGGPDPAGDVPADAADKTVAAVLGEVVWLMSQSAEHKRLSIADLEWMVMPAILLRQFRLFYREGQPVAVVLYGRVSEAVAAGLDGGARPAPADWRSGETFRVIATVAPFGEAEAFAQKVQETLGDVVGEGRTSQGWRETRIVSR